MSYLQQYVTKLNTLSEDTNRRLRQIRQLDRKASAIQKQLQIKQKQFIDRVANTSKSKKETKLRQGLQSYYKQIIALHKECYNVSQQKVKLSDDLYNLVHQPTEKLDNDLKKMKTDFKDDIIGRDPKTRKGKVFKKKQRRGRVDPTAKNSEPIYCYCGKPSYGEMVECENNMCQGEWFHLGCIAEKVLPENWYCANCKKASDIGRTLRGR